MFGFIGKMMGSDKALGGVISGVTKGLDALVYTDEEKAGDAAKNRSEARKMVVEWMASTQGQNLARRFIALSITGVWLLQFIVAQFMSVISVFVATATSEKLTEASKLMRDGATEMNAAVMLILAFYFAAPHMGDIAKAVTGKFTNSVNKG